MKIGIISDVHSNEAALVKVLGLLEKIGIDRIICLGDALGYFSQPVEVVERLIKAGIYCLRGNHEAMFLGFQELNPSRDKIYGLSVCKQILSPSLTAKIMEWPISLSLEADGRKMLFVHGSPWDPVNQYIYPDSDMRNFAKIEYDAIFMGHTHIPFAKTFADKLLINVGSCGLPRDIGNLACFAVYNTKKDEAKIIRTKLDINEIIEKNNSLHPSVIKCLTREPARALSAHETIM